MRASLSYLLLAVGLPSVWGVAKSNCPVYGPLFPTPRNLKNNPKTKAVAKELDKIFKDTTEGAKKNFTFVFQAYAKDEGVIWENSYTAPYLKTANTTGVRLVDGDTVHRVGSITKTFTVMTFLSQVGEQVWNDPVTKYIPEIRDMAARQKSHPKSNIYDVDWDDITIGALITFQSGLMRDYSILGELTQEIPNWQDVITTMGFPMLSSSEVPSCGKAVTCSRKEFLAGIEHTPPFYPVYQTPMYNNIGYVLLSYVAEAITGKDFMQLIEDTIIKPLDLKHTFIRPPNDSYGVIPGDRIDTVWARDFGNEAPTGNIATSANDLTRLGQAIMKSTLLKPAVTRRWLKPISFLPDPAGAVGMPWGIRQINLRHVDYQYVTSFNKAGRVGAYASLMALLPDVDMGWSVMASGEMPENMTGGMADLVADRLLGVWLDVAREEAQQVYGGTYRPSVPGLNSSVVISLNDDRPGMGVMEWISNGTDMRYWGVTFGWGELTAEQQAKLRLSVRLYPTRLEDELSDGGRKVAFRAIFENMDGDKVVNSYVTDCSSWIYTNAIYGSKPLDLFVFTLDKSGRAVSVENMALRLKLDRVS